MRSESNDILSVCSYFQSKGGSVLRYPVCLTSGNGILGYDEIASELLCELKYDTQDLSLPQEILRITISQ